MSEHAPGSAPDEAESPSGPTVDVRALAKEALAPCTCPPVNKEWRPGAHYWGCAVGPAVERYQAATSPRAVLALLDRLEALETALLVRVPIRNHGSAIVCGCCDGTLALEQVGPGCCEMTGSHEAGCAVADVITVAMARVALGRQEASRE